MLADNLVLKLYGGLLALLHSHTTSLTRVLKGFAEQMHALQGEDAVHDAIRQQQLAVGATGRILAALKEWGAENEEVLWAVLFSLAVLVRDGANPFQPAIRAVAAAGIPPLLSCALQSYKVPPLIAPQNHEKLSWVWQRPGRSVR